MQDGREASRDHGTAPGRFMTADVLSASATLFRGVSFLTAWFQQPIANDLDDRSPAIAGRYRAKVMGNGLRELDRFLNLLIDAVSDARGLPVRPGQRNTANKLGAYRAAMALPHRDEARLRALGRSRDCLFHCEGHVRRGDRRDDPAMTLGWPERDARNAPLRKVAIGQELTVSRSDLADVCRFYRRIAIELCGDGIQVSEADLATGDERVGAQFARMPVAASR
jgi:hypothetical protein